MDEAAMESAQRLLEHMGVENVDQAIVEWDRMKKEKDEFSKGFEGLCKLLNHVVAAEGATDFMDLVKKMDQNKRRIAVEREVWKKTNKSLSESIERLEAEVMKGKNSRGKKAGTGDLSEDSDESDNSDEDSVYSCSSSRKRGHIADKKRRTIVRSLPKMDKYDGKKEDWERFYDGFMVRFGCLDDDIAITMLAETVTEKAADTFEGVPRKVKKEGLRQVMKWMKARLSEETPFEAIENEKKLRRIPVRGKKISTVCDELERLTRKLQRGKEKREEMRRNHLVLLYEGREQHEKLLDLYADGESYEKMKAKLLQMEYLQEQIKELRKDSPSNGVDVIHGDGTDVTSDEESGTDVIHGEMSDVIRDRRNRSGVIHGDATDVIYDRRNGRDVIHGEMSDVICNRCLKKGHLRKDCTEKMDSAGRELRMCDHCGKQGHIKESCYQLIGRTGEHQFDENGARSKSDDARNTLKGSGGLVQRVLGVDTGDIQRIQGRSEDGDLDDLFRIKKSVEEEVMINGQVRKAMLDTGAEASLIEEGLLNGIPGVLMETKGRTVLRDASGKEIKLCGRTVLDVELPIGRKAKIGFHVTSSRVGVIIGGVGLDAIGLELRAVEEPVVGCTLQRKHTQDMEDGSLEERIRNRDSAERLSHESSADGAKVLATKHNDLTTSGSRRVDSPAYTIPKVEKKNKEEDLYDIVMIKKCNIKMACFACNGGHTAMKCPDQIRPISGCSLDEKKKKKSKEMFDLRKTGGESRDGDASCWKERGDVRETEEIMKKARKKS